MRVIFWAVWAVAIISGAAHGQQWDGQQIRYSHDQQMVYAPSSAAPPLNANVWYFCPDNQLYYPYTQGCGSAWQASARPNGADMPPVGRMPEFMIETMWQPWVQQKTAEYEERLEEARLLGVANERAAAPRVAQAKQNNADRREGFRRISIQNLAIDKRSIPSGQKLVVAGLYYTEGQQEWLGIVPNNDNAPRVGLITSGAPRDTQYALQRCRISTMCTVTFTGHMVACQLTYFGRTYANDRCLYVTGRR